MSISRNEVVWCDKGWQPVHYAFVPSKKAWKKETKRLKLKEPYPSSHARVCYLKGTDTHERICLVTVNEKVAKTYSSNQIISLLVHEAVHIFQFIVEEMGEENPSVEFEAYSIQAITQNLISAYEKTRGKLTK